MAKAQRSERSPRPAFSHHSAGYRLLDRVIHFRSSQELSDVDAIRQRRLLDTRQELLEEIGRLANTEGPDDEAGLLVLGDETDFTPSISAPINIAGILSIFMSEQNRASFIGDLEERYGLIVEEKGHRSATRWLWREVIHSFFSLAWDAVKRVSGLGWLYRRI